MNRRDIVISAFSGLGLAAFLGGLSRINSKPVLATEGVNFNTIPELEERLSPGEDKLIPVKSIEVTGENITDDVELKVSIIGEEWEINDGVVSSDSALLENPDGDFEHTFENLELRVPEVAVNGETVFEPLVEISSGDVEETVLGEPFTVESFADVGVSITDIPESVEVDGLLSIDFEIENMSDFEANQDIRLVFEESSEESLTTKPISLDGGALGSGTIEWDVEEAMVGEEEDFKLVSETRESNSKSVEFVGTGSVEREDVLSIADAWYIPDEGGFTEITGEAPSAYESTMDVGSFNEDGFGDEDSMIIDLTGQFGLGFETFTLYELENGPDVISAAFTVKPGAISDGEVGTVSFTVTDAGGLQMESGSSEFLSGYAPNSEFSSFGGNVSEGSKNVLFHTIDRACECPGWEETLSGDGSGTSSDPFGDGSTSSKDTISFEFTTSDNFSYEISEIAFFEGGKIPDEIKNYFNQTY